MKKVVLAARRFLTSEDGPTAVEYAIMLAMIVLVCLAAISTLGQKTNSLFNGAASALDVDSHSSTT